MKHRSSRLIVVCLLVCLVLVSCSENQAVRLRYDVEKRLHALEKELAEAQSLKQVSPEKVERFTGEYGVLVEFVYRALDSVSAERNPLEYRELAYLTHQSCMRLAGLLYSARNFDSSAAVLSHLIDRVPLEGRLAMISYVELGRAVQASGNWDSAQTIYNYTIETFAPPLDEAGEIVFEVFNLPTHMFRMVSLLDDSDGAAAEFERAEKYYRKNLSGEDTSRIVLSSRANLAHLYDDTGQWEKELVQLEYLLDTSSEDYLSVSLKIADVLGSRLKRFDTALALYSHVMERIDAEDEFAKASVLFKICLVHMEKGEYDQARSILKQLKEKYRKFYAQTPLAQYTLARSFDKENNWTRAEQEYTLLIEKYRGSTGAMATLLYLVDHYRDQKRDREAQVWFDKAEVHYDRLLARNAGNPFEARVLRFKADLYGRNGRWAEAAEMLLGAFTRYPFSAPGRRAVLKAVDIYKNRLKDHQKADSLMEALKTFVVEAGESPQNPDPFAEDRVE